MDHWCEDGKEMFRKCVVRQLLVSQNDEGYRSARYLIVTGLGRFVNDWRGQACSSNDSLWEHEGHIRCQGVYSGSILNILWSCGTFRGHVRISDFGVQRIFWDQSFGLGSPDRESEASTRARMPDSPRTPSRDTARRRSVPRLFSVVPITLCFAVAAKLLLWVQRLPSIQPAPKALSSPSRSSGGRRY